MDQKYIEENIDIAIKDYLKLKGIERIFCLLINVAIFGFSFLLLDILDFPFSNFNDLEYFKFAYVASIPTSLFASYFTFKLLLKAEYEGKRMLVNRSLTSVSISFVWRVYLSGLFLMVLDRLIGKLTGFYFIDLIPTVVTGGLAVYISWLWFVLSNSKHIEFKFVSESPPA